MNLQSLKQDIEHPAKYSGLLATILGIISYLPVLYTVFKTKKTTNFPYEALILAIIANLLWVYYGLGKSQTIDYQIVLMGVLFFFIYVSILFIKINY